MRVIVSRSGGFAGLSVTWQLDVDEQPDPDSWRDLIDRLPWAHVASSAPQPDRYSYRIRCAPHDATLAEQQLEGPWRELVDRVQSHGDSHPPVAERD